jgi:AraC-like DNA-binding protein
MSSNLFSELTPSQLLKPYVQSFWAGSFNMDGAKHFSQSVLPNGCIELIIHLSEAHCFLYKPTGNWSSSPAFTLLGLYDKPYEVKFSQAVNVFGIRFYPDGIRNVFGVSPAEFRATYEDSVDALGNSFREFCFRLRDMNEFPKQIEFAEEFIMKNLSTHVKPYDYTHFAMKLIRQSQGMGDYKKLTEEVPISLRQLQREFKLVYGITVMDYMRLVRLNAIQNYMHAGNARLSDIPYELNFTDQSHFIREFRNYAGVAPGKFRKFRDKFIVNPVPAKLPA